MSNSETSAPTESPATDFSSCKNSTPSTNSTTASIVTPAVATPVTPTPTTSATSSTNPTNTATTTSMARFKEKRPEPLKLTLSQDLPLDLSIKSAGYLSSGPNGGSHTLETPRIIWQDNESLLIRTSKSLNRKLRLSSAGESPPITPVTPCFDMLSLLASPNSQLAVAGKNNNSPAKSHNSDSSLSYRSNSSGNLTTAVNKSSSSLRPMSGVSLLRPLNTTSFSSMERIHAGASLSSDAVHRLNQESKISKDKHELRQSNDKIEISNNTSPENARPSQNDQATSESNDQLSHTVVNNQASDSSLLNNSIVLPLMDTSNCSGGSNSNLSCLTVSTASTTLTPMSSPTSLVNNSNTGTKLRPHSSSASSSFSFLPVSPLSPISPVFDLSPLHSSNIHTINQGQQQHTTFSHSLFNQMSSPTASSSSVQVWLRSPTFSTSSKLSTPVLSNKVMSDPMLAGSQFFTPAGCGQTYFSNPATSSELQVPTNIGDGDKVIDSRESSAAIVNSSAPQDTNLAGIMDSVDSTNSSSNLDSSFSTSVGSNQGNIQESSLKTSHLSHCNRLERLTTSVMANQFTLHDNDSFVRCQPAEPTGDTYLNETESIDGTRQKTSSAPDSASVTVASNSNSTNDMHCMVPAKSVMPNMNAHPQLMLAQLQSSSLPDEDDDDIDTEIDIQIGPNTARDIDVDDAYRAPVNVSANQCVANVSPDAFTSQANQTTHKLTVVSGCLDTEQTSTCSDCRDSKSSFTANNDLNKSERPATSLGTYFGCAQVPTSDTSNGHLMSARPSTAIPRITVSDYYGHSWIDQSYEGQRQLSALTKDSPQWASNNAATVTTVVETSTGADCRKGAPNSLSQSTTMMSGVKSISTNQESLHQVSPGLNKPSLTIINSMDHNHVHVPSQFIVAQHCYSNHISDKPIRWYSGNFPTSLMMESCYQQQHQQQQQQQQQRHLMAAPCTGRECNGTRSCEPKLIGDTGLPFDSTEQQSMQLASSAIASHSNILGPYCANPMSTTSIRQARSMPSGLTMGTEHGVRVSDALRESETRTSDCTEHHSVSSVTTDTVTVPTVDSITVERAMTMNARLDGQLYEQPQLQQQQNLLTSNDYILSRMSNEMLDKDEQRLNGSHMTATAMAALAMSGNNSASVFESAPNQATGYHQSRRQQQQQLSHTGPRCYRDSVSVSPVSPCSSLSMTALSVSRAASSMSHYSSLSSTSAALTGNNIQHSTGFIGCSDVDSHSRHLVGPYSDHYQYQRLHQRSTAGSSRASTPRSGRSTPMARPAVLCRSSSSKSHNSNNNNSGRRSPMSALACPTVQQNRDKGFHQQNHHHHQQQQHHHHQQQQQRYSEALSSSHSDTTTATTTIDGNIIESGKVASCRSRRARLVTLTQTNSHRNPTTILKSGSSIRHSKRAHLIHRSGHKTKATDLMIGHVDSRQTSGNISTGSNDAIAIGTNDRSSAPKTTTDHAVISKGDISRNNEQADIAQLKITKTDKFGTDKHVLINGPRRYMCDMCTKSFTRSDMLTRHRRLHSGDRPFQCNECKQEFSRSDHLSTHLRTHTACRKDMITRHMKVHIRHVSTSKEAKIGVPSRDVVGPRNSTIICDTFSVKDANKRTTSSTSTLVVTKQTRAVSNAIEPTSEAIQFMPPTRTDNCGPRPQDEPSAANEKHDNSKRTVYWQAVKSSTDNPSGVAAGQSNQWTSQAPQLRRQ
ncbi:Early growth response protein 1, partial [Fragariocoptes setiger]